MRPNTIERIKEMLENNSIKDPIGGCWLYQAGSKDHSGHCKIRFQGTWRQIHRLSAHIHWGFNLDSPILILHQQECSNKNCWNPDHLYEGTQKENVRDSIETGTHITQNPGSRDIKTHCPYGHLLDGQGATQRYCKTCKRIRKQEHDANLKMSTL